MVLRFVLSEIAFAFHLAGEEIQKQSHEKDKEGGLEAYQEFSCWPYWIEVAKADGRSSDKAEIH